MLLSDPSGEPVTRRLTILVAQHSKGAPMRESRLDPNCRRMRAVAALDPSTDPARYHAWCRATALALADDARLGRQERAQLTGVVNALDACANADHLLVVPLDRWALFAAAERELAALWNRYDRGNGRDVQAD